MTADLVLTKNGLCLPVVERGVRFPPVAFRRGTSGFWQSAEFHGAPEQQTSCVAAVNRAGLMDVLSAVQCAIVETIVFCLADACPDLF